MKRLMKYIRPEVKFIVFTMIIKFVATFAELWIPSLMETMLDEKVPQGEAGQIYLYGGLMLLAAVAAFSDREGNPPRVDILQALNRMSSMLYLLMIQEKSKK